MILTLQQLQYTTGSTSANASLYLDQINNSFAAFDIRDRVEVAAFLSQIGHESQYLTKVEEDLYYRDPARIASIFKRVFDLNKDKVISPQELANAQPYARNPRLLAQKLYNNFQGRGLMQLTWEGNYRIIGDMVGKDYVNNPHLLLEPEDAALSAVAFWVHSGAGQFADDPVRVRTAINGRAMLGLDETRQMFARGLQAL